MFAEIYWNFSPEIFSIGPIHVRWYGLLFALGFVVGYQIMSKIFQKEAKSQKDLESLTIYMIIGTVLGARLGHCFFYAPEYYLMNPIEIIKVWEGGLASHGAAIGILIALYFFTKKRKHITYIWILDRIVIVIALAGAFIRLGNFFNSEIVGIPTDLPWGVVFERLNENFARHPAQLYESLAYILIFIFLIIRYNKLNIKLQPGWSFGMFLVLIFGARFIIEFIKKEQSSFEVNLPLDMGQLLSIPFILIGIYFLFWSAKYKKVS